MTALGSVDDHPWTCWPDHLVGGHRMQAVLDYVQEALLNLILTSIHG